MTPCDQAAGTSAPPRMMAAMPQIHPVRILPMVVSPEFFRTREQSPPTIAAEAVRGYQIASSSRGHDAITVSAPGVSSSTLAALGMAPLKIRRRSLVSLSTGKGDFLVFVSLHSSRK